MLRLIRSYLRRRSFRIKLEGQRSAARTATSGVPQGSALSPLLFNIYISDIPTTAHVNMAMYADDVCIYTRSLDARVVDRRLQEALDALQTWYARWRIAIHPGKSTAILFSGSGCRLKKHGNPTELTIQGGIVPWHSQAKYLGITLDSRLNWGAHIHKTIDRGKQMAGTLAPLLNGRSKLDLARKIQLYKTVLRPTVTYASAVWATAAQCHRIKLQNFQNRMLRWALDAPWFVRNTTIHEDAGVEPLLDYIRKTATKTFDTAREHQNPLVSNSQDYDSRLPWKYPRPRSLLTT
ncbi:hypothetical protein Trydic_g15542 [Trypoxylus dichotomus]